MSLNTKEQANKLLAHMNNGIILQNERFGTHRILKFKGTYHGHDNARLCVEIDTIRNTVNCLLCDAEFNTLTSGYYHFSKPTFKSLLTSIEAMK